MSVIKIFGWDFTPFNQSNWRVDGIDQSPVYNVNADVHLKLTEGNIGCIIQKLLDESEHLKRNSNSTKNLYTNFGNEMMFDGFVGVISGKVSFFGKELGERFFSETAQDNQLYEINVVLEIDSRFDKDKTKPFFLVTMLQEEESIRLTEQDVPSNEDNFFDFLLLIRFKECLKVAVYKGYYKTYSTFHYNDDCFRGSVDASRHIRLNMGLNNGKIAYSVREKSYDNCLNHLIVAAFKYFERNHMDITQEYFGWENEKIIENLSTEINYPKYDNRTIISRNLYPISHPYYTEYEELRKISLQILRNESLSIFDGENEEVEGILFYIPDLFEDFLEKTMKGCERCSFDSQDELRVFGYPDDFKQETRPDFVFYDQNKPYMVLDAKFKPKWSEVISGEKALGNLMGDFDKCIRDMNAHNCHATGVIFPSEIEIEDGKYEHHISEYNTTDIFYTIPFKVPDEKNDYNKWREELKKTCSVFRKSIEKIISNNIPRTTL